MVYLYFLFDFSNSQLNSSIIKSKSFLYLISPPELIFPDPTTLRMRSVENLLVYCMYRETT